MSEETTASALGQPVTAAAPETPATEAAPVYAKAREDAASATTLWMITCDEGWRLSILCGGMYERDADFLLSVLGRTPRGARTLAGILASHPADDVKPAPELSGSVVRVISTAPELREATAETRGYRQALARAREILDEGGTTHGSHVSRARSVIRAALEGK